MPSESELRRVFDVSRITVHQALGDLQNEGLIFKIHGKGTFVAKPKAFQNVSALQGLVESMSQMGYEVIHRLTRLKHLPASVRVAERLQLEEGAPIMRIERLTHGADGTPLDFEYLYYRGDAFPVPPAHRPQQRRGTTCASLFVTEAPCCGCPQQAVRALCMAHPR